MIWLAALFFGVAVCYSSVGFGGGSSYTAILAAQGEGSEAIRQISLLCNVIVVTIGGIASWRRIRLELMLPLLLTSIPAVWLGAGWKLGDAAFFTVLASALMIAGLLLFWKIPTSEQTCEISKPALLGLGAGLGVLAGVTGIGGGIYLAPVLHLMRAGKAHEIAAVATWFILINSLVGSIAVTASNGFGSIQSHSWLLLSVAFGALIGSKLLQGNFNEAIIRRVTGVLIIIVAARLFYGA